jgi:hypothetical protein
MADENLGGGSAAASAGAGATGEGQQQQQQQHPTGGGQQQQQQQPGSGAGAGGNAEKTYNYKEDRSDWIPRHRLNETSGKLTAAEKERETLKAELESERKRVQALAGVTPKDPKEQQTTEIKEALYSMFPQLKTLENLTSDQLEQVFEAANAARSTAAAAWQRHATGMLSDLNGEAAKVLGTETLTATQQRNLQNAYREEAAAAVRDRQLAMKRGERETLETLPSDTDFVARHERGDKGLIKEFVKTFLNDWFEPARRSVNAAQERRNMRPVPRGERARILPAAGAAKVDLNNEGEFKKALLAARGGGQE